MKRVVSALMCAVMVLCVSISALAAAPERRVKTIYFEDGSYATIETIIEDEVRIDRANSSKSGSTSYTYSKGGKKAWTFTLRGSFTYNGTTSKATKASVTSSISDRTWSLDSKSSDYSGDTAYGDASYSSPDDSYDVSLSLSCDEDGNIY